MLKKSCIFAFENIPHRGDTRKQNNEQNNGKAQLHQQGNQFQLQD